MKILINTPYLSSPAGVSSHYLGLKPYFSRKVVYNKFFTANYIKRKVKIKFMHKPLRLIGMSYDIIKYVTLIIICQQPTILLNPSFNKTALKRDVLFLSIAKFFGCKVVVFIHGWDKDYLGKIFTGEIGFHPAWRKVDAFFVLAKEFKGYLEKLSIKAPVFLTTTKVNDKILDSINNETKCKEIRTILFLARVEKAKGIFITLNTFQILKKKYAYLKLHVVGSGNMLDQARNYVSERGINDVNFTGPLYGDDLKKEFISADLYILPSLGEGMPTSVLEAMGFGLPVITRPVGGLKDFFKNDKMGYLIESLEPNVYAEHIDELINNPDKAHEISVYNKQYVKEHFLASKVARDLENVLSSL